jgi:hypothetical protein
MQPLVTFIMPSVYDKFLVDAVNSIKMQTLQEFEVLFFDNTEAGRGLDFRDNRFRMFKTPGWTAAKCNNEAIRLAESEILIQAHDDDLSFPERAEVVRYFIEKGADLVYSSAVTISEGGRETGIYYAKKFDFQRHRLTNSQVPFSFCAYRRSSSPVIDEELKLIYDYAFIYQAWKSGLRFFPILSPLGYMRNWMNRRRKCRDLVRRETQRMRVVFNDPLIRSELLDVPEWENQDP